MVTDGSSFLLSLMTSSLAGHTTAREDKQLGCKAVSWDKGSFVLLLPHGMLQEGAAGLREQLPGSEVKSLALLKWLFSSEAKDKN